MGNFLSDFMESLSSGSHKNVVYLSVTPGVGLELCQVDMQTKLVKAYAVRDLEYNETARDIADYEAFKAAVADMFEELQINPKCDVVVNMPLCTLGIMNLPLISGDEAITTGVTAEVEQSYIFSRLEPVVAWSDIHTASSANSDSRKILYSAIQKTIIEKLTESLAAIGATLVGVELSIISYLRALDFAGYTTTQMKENVTWNLLLVTATGYSLVSMVGKNIVDYYEEPLATKTFEGEEIYNAINASAQITLMSYPANYLYIISETDMVSAELLAKKIQNAGTVDYFENNSFKKHEVTQVGLDVLPDNVLKISLQAVGCAVSGMVKYPVDFDFIKDGTKASNDDVPVPLPFGDPPIEISPAMATKIAAGILAIALIIFGGLGFLVLPKIEANKTAQVDDINSKVSELEKKLKEVESEQDSTGSFSINKQVDTVLKNNRTKLLNYSALGSSIPSSVWLTYFMTSDNGLVDIKGEASNVEDVYVFFKNMKDSLINTTLRLQKLQMQAGSVDDVLSGSDKSHNYEFEITNMDANQLNALMGINPADPNAPKDANANNQNKDSGANNNNNNNNNNNGGAAPNNKLLSDKPVQVN